MPSYQLGNLAAKVAAGTAKGPGRLMDLAQSALTGDRVSGLMKANPLTGGSLAYLGGHFGYSEIYEPFAEASGGYGRMVQAVGATRDYQMQVLLKRLELEQAREAMLRSAARLAATNPQLYNEVMAGRKLPEDAIVIGGRPRVDLMEELAYQMAQGEFRDEAPGRTQDELASLLMGQ